MSATPVAMRPPGSRRLLNSWQLLRALTTRDLRLRYQESVFGWAWSMLNPLSYGLVLYFAFGVILKAGFADYPLFLMAGVFPWFWFQGAVQQSTTVFVGNAGLLKKVRFPRLILPLSIVFGNTLQFLLTVPVLVVFLVASHKGAHWSWLVTLPMLFTIQIALMIGLCALLSSLTVFFRDLQHISEVILNLLFYATPILYDIERIPAKYRWVATINPYAALAEGWRGAIMSGHWPGEQIIPCLLWAGGFLVVGLWVFHRLEDSFADAV